MANLPSSPSPQSAVKSDSVLGTARIIAQLTKDVTELAKVPFASEAASLVLSLLEVAKEVKDNEDARVRLATSAGTYLARLRPFLESTSEASETLKGQLDDFNMSLLGISNDLEAMRKKRLFRKIWGKDHITTKLLDRERALRDAYDSLMMWAALDTNIALRVNSIQTPHEESVGFDPDEMADIRRFTLTDVRSRGYIKNSPHFCANVELGSVCSTGQRVIVKKVASKMERDREAKMWLKLRHPNLLHIVGCTSDNSKTQFILFHDEVSVEAPRTVQICSLAAFLLEFSRVHDTFSLVDKMIDFVNNAISAVRHMQAALRYDEDETACLAMIIKYTISYDGRIIVTPPLQALTRAGLGVWNGIFNSLFPIYGTSEASMRRYFVNLDSVPTHTTLAEVLDGEQLEKWAVLDSIRLQIRTLPNGYVKPQQHVTPETRWASTDYSINIVPGDFGVLVPGENNEFAFRRIGNPVTNNCAVFEYKSWQWLYDRDRVEFKVVCEQPKPWKIDRLTDGFISYHQNVQTLTHAVHLSKRFLQLSAPKDCNVDELVFVVGVRHFCHYQNDRPIEDGRAAAIYSRPLDRSADELRFSHCTPSMFSDSFDHPLNGGVRIEKYYDLRIEYVKVPVERHTARLNTYEENFEGSHKIGAFRYKEYESAIRRPILNEKLFWAEWP